MKSLAFRKKLAMKHPDKLGAGAEQRSKYLKGKEKIGTVMSEFKRGTLHSGSGDKVTKPDQAMAIALSEAGKSKPSLKSKFKKSTKK